MAPPGSFSATTNWMRPTTSKTTPAIGKGKLRQNQFGASAGGPIIKNKIFFFGDYEGFRRVQGQAENGNVPTKPDAEQRLHRSLGHSPGQRRHHA